MKSVFIFFMNILLYSFSNAIFKLNMHNYRETSAAGLLPEASIKVYNIPLV